ncbi:MAG TPA: DUF1028 domain-containing protein [Anaerolineales bacterium]|jgi:uncharacterized Ntn-hydrolase superfamily protein|nr:DUF1028 domain-containing protein [Anaerolineales bacterium]
MLHVSTFSIVACDLKAQAWGVAVASKFPAVGAVVPWAKAKAGAVATQSIANTSFGPRGLELMASGLSAEETLQKLLSHDRDRDNRQVGLVDAKGKSASFTGKSCSEWAGSLIGPGYAIQGNILAGSEVIQQMERAFLDAKGNLPERLFAALEAGSNAGGDRRGRQSAAITVVKAKAGYGGYNDRWVDYRVDDNLQPVARLGDLLELHRLYFGKSPKSQRVMLEGNVAKDVQQIMKSLGYYTPTDGKYDDATREAFRVFIDNENFEARANPDAGWIDRPVLEYLMKKLG